METPELTDLKQPIAIRTEHVAEHQTTLYIKQFRTLQNRDGDFKVYEDLGEAPERRQLFFVDGRAPPFKQRRYFYDTSGAPLFDISGKKGTVTWCAYFPGEKKKSEPIARFAPRWNPLINMLDVYVKNSAGNGEEVKLKVRGQDLLKHRIHVYLDKALVMSINRIRGHAVATDTEWTAEVARGMDISLVSPRLISN
ncbi:hypothetical protein PHISCL_01220 [Aspergillus sclerotialis]|uniref:Uncharacterized protein n=1 Tax=Aspergillus sclerotialis TaxID=2070753 RepID=A0A3A2ZTD8_9EURO|nr:hypothetical protein PHISCL_01220 [Aspergillus sclerotialis]